MLVPSQHQNLMIYKNSEYRCCGDTILVEQITEMGILYARNTLKPLEPVQGKYHV
jgi:hypothetical protein